MFLNSTNLKAYNKYYYILYIIASFICSGHMPIVI